MVSNQVAIHPALISGFAAMQPAGSALGSSATPPRTGLITCPIGERYDGEHDGERPRSDAIQQLAHEEHALLSRLANGSTQDGERQRLQQLELTLDQCWDLLRQRRALARVGRDAREARARPAETVAAYEQ